jgi:hypothetical protein
LHDPETKRQSGTCLRPNKPKSQKVRMQKSRVKMMWTAIFYAKGIIRHEFMTKKHTANVKLYKGVIKRLIAPVQLLMPQFQESGFWYILQ